MSTTANTTRALELEKRYWDAMRSGDSKAVLALTSDPCIVVGADGASQITARQLAEMLDDASYNLKSYRIDEQSVHTRELSDSVVSIAYGIHEESERDGKPIKLDAFDSSVWVRTGDSWKCAVHTESLAAGASR
jgi:ketosteroid isomerase-like protein